MGENTRHSLDEFTFGGDGLFFDPIGQPCVLIGTVEFQNFCHVLDESFDTPLGRRLIYAATDGEERSLHDQKLFQFGRWFGRRRVERALQQRAKSMGWGWFEGQQILSPAHDGLTVGFLLAHAEHLTKSRFELEWNQRSPELIQAILNPKQGAMVPAPRAHRLNWSDTSEAGSLVGTINLELDVRDAAFFSGEARSFFLPIDVLHHLISGLRGRPVRKMPSLSIAHIAEEFEEPEVFAAVVHAAIGAYKRTEYPIFLQAKEDWNGHLQSRLTSRGFGTVEVQKSPLDGDDSTRFLIRSPVPALVAGTLLGMWQRAHGKRCVVSFDLEPSGLVVEVREPAVDY
tara:strand:+ start:344 stop:1369 length:1026 start_codon:yes stop_codon:yes gene_type:complete